jgi:hypothetical protein
MFSASDDKLQSMRAYNEQYGLAMERILNQPTYQADRALATLAWLTFACRPLRPVELCNAPAIRLSDDKSEIDPDYLPDIVLLISICDGLVALDEEAGIMRLVHYTTQDYLVRTHEQWFPRGKKQVALECISYLSLDEFKQGGLSNKPEEYHYEILKRYPFFDYTAHHWAEHARSVEPEILGEFYTFLRDENTLDSISAATTSYRTDYTDISWTTMLKWTHFTPISMMVRQGLDETLQKYLDEGYGLADTGSSLEEAARKGHLSIIRTLLDQIVNMNLKNDTGSALIAAATKGHTDIVQMHRELLVRPQSRPRRVQGDGK